MEALDNLRKDWLVVKYNNMNRVEHSAGFYQEETIMATRNFDMKNYCDTLFNELTAMKTKLNGFVGQIEHAEGKDKMVLGFYADHLREIIHNIDWKLEVLGKACPYDWAGFSEGVESTVSVPARDTEKEKGDFSGGYVGG